MKAERKGFSLVELLMVLGVMSLLMGMLIPSVGVVREKAQRMATAQKLRQIGIAVATYHTTAGKPLVADSLEAWIAELARETGLREGDLFLFDEDPLVMELTSGIPPVLVENSGGGDWEPVGRFSGLPIGVAVASGVSPLSDPSTTPVAWTRGLTESGSWEGFGSDRSGIYGSDGGFIVFLDGHVEFHRNLTHEGGQLITWEEGRRTANIREALGPGTKAYDFLGQVF